MVFSIVSNVVHLINPKCSMGGSIAASIAVPTELLGLNKETGTGDAEPPTYRQTIEAVLPDIHLG